MFPKHVQQCPRVFIGGDTAEQNILARGAIALVQLRRVAKKRAGKSFVTDFDGNFRNGSKLIQRQDRFWRDESQTWNDHQGVRYAFGSRSKRLAVCFLAPKIQSTDETIDLRDGGRASTKAHGQVELRLFPHQHHGPWTADARGRKEEHPGKSRPA